MRRIKQLEQIKEDKKPRNEVTRQFENIMKDRGSTQQKIKQNRDNYGFKE